MGQLHSRSWRLAESPKTEAKINQRPFLKCFKCQMYEMLKLQHNGVKIYKSGFPKVALSMLAQRKAILWGEVWRIHRTSPWKSVFQKSVNSPIQDYWQFIAHQELREHGLDSQDKERVFININWAAQLFTTFNKCFPACHSQSRNILPPLPSISSHPRIHLRFICLFMVLFS